MATDVIDVRDIKTFTASLASKQTSENGAFISIDYTINGKRYEKAPMFDVYGELTFKPQKPKFADAGMSLGFTKDKSPELFDLIKLVSDTVKPVLEQAIADGSIRCKCKKGNEFDYWERIKSTYGEECDLKLHKPGDPLPSPTCKVSMPPDPNAPKRGDFDKGKGKGKRQRPENATWCDLRDLTRVIKKVCSDGVERSIPQEWINAKGEPISPANFYTDPLPAGTKFDPMRISFYISSSKFGFVPKFTMYSGRIIPGAGMGDRDEWAEKSMTSTYRPRVVNYENAVVVQPPANTTTVTTPPPSNPPVDSDDDGSCSDPDNGTSKANEGGDIVAAAIGKMAAVEVSDPPAPTRQRKGVEGQRRHR